jgi:hypothetical protein
MSKNEDLGDTEPRGVSRRTVAIGAAWAVPVIALATASPAYAASCVPTPVVSNASCKKANEKSYKLLFTIGGSDCTANSCTGTINKITQSTGGGLVIWPGPPSPADGTTPIIVCNTDNMSAYVVVNATITCGTSTTTQDYTVKMPNFNSAGNTCTDSNFC